MRTLAAFAMMFLFSAEAGALPCSSDLMPMPDTEAVEVAIQPDKALEAACMRTIGKTIFLNGLPLGKRSFTRHPKWGDIVRMDVGTPTPDRYSRILCTRYQGQQMVQVSMYDMNKDVCDGHGLAIGISAAPRPRP